MNTTKKSTQEYSIGLEYEIENDDAWVIGIGTCTDKNLIIPIVNENGNRVIGIRGAAFKNCETIVTVVISKSVQIIEDCAFSKCFNIKSIKLHYGLKEIWGFAFEECESLTSIKIPSSVTNIGNTPIEDISADERLLRVIFGERSRAGSGNPFKGCKKLRSIRVNSGNRRYREYINCLIDKEKKTIISGCKSSILPDGDLAEIIGPYAFYDCGDAFKNGLYIFANPEIKVIEQFAFAKCNIEKLFFPNTLIRIEQSAFRDCSNLKEVNFPNSLIDIGCCAFKGCSNMSEIVLPSSVHKIHSSAFEQGVDIKIKSYKRTAKKY